MRLQDLNPRWIAIGLPPCVIKYGISFDCPHCVVAPCPTCGHTPDRKRLAVLFAPAIYDRQAINDEIAAGSLAALYRGPVHTRRGEAFEDLTITPSIGFDSIGHWHGSITGGAIV